MYSSGDASASGSVSNQTATQQYNYANYADWYKYYYANYYGQYQYSGAHTHYQPHTAHYAPAPPPPPGTEETVKSSTPLEYKAPPASCHQLPPVAAEPAGSGALQSNNLRFTTVGGKRAGPGNYGPSSKKNKVPVPPVACTICDITVSSEQVYLTHVNGKSHKKKVASLGSGLSQPSSASPSNPTVLHHGIHSPCSGTKKRPVKKKREKLMDANRQNEQVVYQCSLCNVTVNSEQQLDLHLTGTKHGKTLNRLSKSNDPEVVAKVTRSQQQAKALKEQLQRRPAVSGLALTPLTSFAIDAASEVVPNLPPGYVVIPGLQSQFGKDTYLCSTCQHQSTDVFSLNAHVQSAEHKTRSAEQEKPLETKSGLEQGLESLQAKSGVAKTNFQLGVNQTASGRWKLDAQLQLQMLSNVEPLSSSFVSGEVLK